MLLSPARLKVRVLGLENWPLDKLIDRMAEAADYNRSRGFETLMDCPAAWREYVTVLGNEWARRGAPTRLF
jgi:hypothetical protein